MMDEVEDDPFYKLALYKEFMLTRNGSDVFLSYLGIKFAACPLGRRGDLIIYSRMSHLSQIHSSNLMKVFWRLGGNDSCLDIRIVARPLQAGQIYMYDCFTLYINISSSKEKRDVIESPTICNMRHVYHVKFNTLITQQTSSYPRHSTTTYVVIYVIASIVAMITAFVYAFTYASRNFDVNKHQR